jgi:hypothetical protein
MTNRGSCFDSELEGENDMSKVMAEKLGASPVIDRSVPPCPFCGAAAQIEYWHGGGPQKRRVSCSGGDCEVSPGVTGKDYREAIERWSRGELKMEKHFVTYSCPGTLVSEESTRPIDSWDVATAIEMAKGIVGRYGVKPYRFRFSTRSRSHDDLDSHVSATSPMYYLGGRIDTVADVLARNDPKEDILRWNMEINGIDKIIVNGHVTVQFNERDVLLDVSL